MPFLEMHCAILDHMQFSSVFRGDEMLRLDHESLRITVSSVDSAITETLRITENITSIKAYFQFTRGLHKPI